MFYYRYKKTNKKKINSYVFIIIFFQTCSQLIKAGLKLSIQSKRKLSSGDSSCGDELIKMSRKEIEPDSSDEDDDDYDYKSPKTGVSF